MLQTRQTGTYRKSVSHAKTYTSNKTPGENEKLTTPSKKYVVLLNTSTSRNKVAVHFRVCNDLKMLSIEQRQQNPN